MNKGVLIALVLCCLLSSSIGGGLYWKRCDIGFEECPSPEPVADDSSGADDSIGSTSAGDADDSIGSTSAGDADDSIGSTSAGTPATPATPSGTPATPATPPSTPATPATPATPSGTPATPSSTPATPASTHCKAIVYKDTNYKGDFKEITTNIPVLNDTDFGRNNISSIKLSGDCGIVKLHDNDNYGGKFTEVWEDIPDLRGYGFNDKTSAISFGEYGKNKCRVQLFQHGDYKGDIRNMTESISSISKSLGFNDKISSMKIGSDCGKVTVYKDSKFNKDPRVVTGNIPKISTVAYNDAISSIKIE